MSEFLDIFLHIDKYLASLIIEYGLYIYIILFSVIFLETGVVATPFLPGDSLLFAAGAIAASAGGLNIWILFVVIFLAAVIGDSVNYSIGNYFGCKILEGKESMIFRREYIARTEEFYLEHGSKAIVIGRFFPIVRTFAPFVAGVCKMEYRQFFYYNVVGALIWVLVFLFGGYLFGNIKVVQDNFTAAVFVVIVASFVLPWVYHVLFHNRK